MEIMWNRDCFCVQFEIAANREKFDAKRNGLLIDCQCDSPWLRFGFSCWKFPVFCKNPLKTTGVRGFNLCFFFQSLCCSLLYFCLKCHHSVGFCFQSDFYTIDQNCSGRTHNRPPANYRICLWIKTWIKGELSLTKILKTNCSLKFTLCPRQTTPVATI